ncbi:MAG: dynamin family protein [Pseudonocardiaceae bacterium]
MNGLKEYQRRRLELGDMIRAALHVARERSDEQTGTRARQLLARLAEDRFQLAVVGQFSRGKSTLMNAILGAAYLPTGVLPMTSVVTTVSYGSRPLAMVRRLESRLAIETPLAEVARFVAQSSAERSELQVASVDVEVPAEVLRLGFAFIDTPGIGSAIEVNTATTKRFLPQADAVIFVTGFDSVLTADEVEFLAEVGRHVGKLFLVINKRDLVAADGAAEVMEFVARRLRDDLQLGEPRVFALSALEALQARVQVDDERLADSGLLPLEAALEQFLTTEKTTLFLRNIAARTAKLVTGQRRDLGLGRLTTDGGADPEMVAAAFEARIDDLDIQQGEIAQKIANRIDADLPGLLAARSPAWQADLQQRLAPTVDEVLSDQADAVPGRGVFETARDRLERAGAAIVREWLDRRGVEVHDLVMGVVADEIGALFELCRSPGVVGADIAGLALAEDRAGLAGWSAEDVPAAVVPLVDWTIALPPMRWSHLRPAARDTEIRRRLLDALGAAVTTFEDRARQALQDAARSWVELLCGQAQRQTWEAADRFRHSLGTAPRDEDLATLDELTDRLADFQAALDTWEPGDVSSRAGEHATVGELAQVTHAESAAERTGICAVCDQLEATVSEYLRHDQFRLATSEHHQTRHAQAGGYCPLHTWQYAAIGSPVGISSGYARLTESLADTLDSFDQPSSTIAELAQSVADLARRPEKCPVCTALTAAEHGTVAEIASATVAHITLCLRHVALVLAANPAPDDGRAMLRALATTLRRNSQDMRAYALKREALHSELITDEESRAYLAALHLLAGRPEIVQPWGRITG